MVSIPEPLQRAPVPDFVPTECGFSALAWETPRSRPLSEAYALITEKALESLEITLPDALDKAVWKRRVEYTLGRLCARSALAQLQEDDATLGIGENREPVWPSGFVGSITHTRGYVAAIAGKNYRGMGLDSELMISPKTARQILRHVLTEKDQALDTGLEKLEEWVTLAFSAKESIYKCLFPTVKRYFGFHAVSFIEFNSDFLRFELNEALADSLPRGWKGEVQFERSLVGVNCACFFRGEEN